MKPSRWVAPAGPDRSPRHDGSRRSLRFFVGRVLAAEPAVFGKLQFVRRRALVLGRRVVTTLAIGAGKRDEHSHGSSPLYFIG